MQNSWKGEKDSKAVFSLLSGHNMINKHKKKSEITFFFWFSNLHFNAVDLRVLFSNLVPLFELQDDKGHVVNRPCRVSRAFAMHGRGLLCIQAYTVSCTCEVWRRYANIVDTIGWLKLHEERVEKAKINTVWTSASWALLLCIFDCDARKYIVICIVSTCFTLEGKLWVSAFQAPFFLRNKDIVYVDTIGWLKPFLA